MTDTPTDHFNPKIDYWKNAYTAFLDLPNPKEKTALRGLV